VTVNRITLGVFDGAEIIYWLADHIEHAAQSSFADRHRNRTAGIDGLHAAHHAVCWQHRNCADATFTQVLLHFGDQVDRSGTSKPSETIRSA
jgi:hypothetical protein